MQIPVLTYHAVNITSNSYRENDHVALASDLQTIHDQGYRVVPLDRVFDWHQRKIPDEAVHKAVAITFDDGSWFDFYDLDHPECGIQRSMLGILADFQKELGAGQQPGLHSTSFVIASPDARRELDEKCLVGKGWWGDEWWQLAVDSGLMSIGCHSWDHNHPDLDRVAQQQQRKGSFCFIDNIDDCEVQLAKAGDYIASKLDNARASFFAFPWGESNEFLLNTYLPDYQARHGFQAAFSTDRRPVRRNANRWNLPRFVCGRDWRSSNELERILAGGRPVTGV